MKNRYKVIYRYKVILGVFLVLINLILLFLMKVQQGCVEQWKESSRKNKSQFILMKQWINIKQEGKKLENYFVDNNYKRIAVYGMGDVGLALLKELKNSKVEIVYGIDRNAKNIHTDINVFLMNDNLINVDAVVVTLIKEFDTVSNQLMQRLNCPVLLIEDIINEL